jgi:hypothetical protein
MAPDAAALAAITAHREAERFVGVPAEQVVRLPSSPADEAGWKAVWERLGAPATKEGYDFSQIKFADGTPLDPNFAEFMRTQAAAMYLPKDKAVGLTQAFTKFLEGQEAAEAAETTARLAQERDTLAKNWGNNFEANKFVASQAALKLGFTPQEISALEGVVGYAKVMEAMRRVGQSLGEDKYVAGSGSSSGGVMTRDQAVARKAELMADRAWGKSYLEGDAAKVREMTALNVIIAGNA